MLKRVSLWIVLSCVSVTGFGAEYNHDAAETNAKLGLAYLQKGLYAMSKERLLSAIKEDPEIAASWYSMAYYLEKTGSIKAADEYYRKAIEVEPHSGSAINNYGTFLCRTDRYQEAIQAFLKAAHEKAYLQEASAYENAGICALKIPNNALAIKYFHQAIDNNPSMPFSLLSLARLNHEMGNEASAQKYFMLFKNLALYNKPDNVVEQYRQYAFSARVTASKQLPMP
ncbi:MAG: type IV pilus biogenesis/stability protein PilW [Gammaproteobacteria bacterium RIFCSPHIGHO2_12_FULL_40_19]|nr:MAG: type IV pilus biogenesis/stability protein PilW [Gammaproteobacteria bacterium RIFCSPHIGHO2_12_FULL_40_19]